MDITGHRTVITGGEGDLARAIASTLQSAGCTVDAPGREQLDVTKPQQVRDYFALHPVDLLICNAGITRDEPLARLTEKDWDEVMDVNLHGALGCARAAIGSMTKKGAGHIVMISSYSAIHPPIGQAAYATAKAAILGLVTDLANRHGKDNIRINAILPGFLETRMTAGLTESRKEQVVAQHALGRLNTCSQVAAFIRVLHQELIHTSGQVFQLDSRSPL